MVKFVNKIVRMIVAGVISIIILSLFSMVYSNTGVHISNGTGATDYKWEPYQFKSTMSEGWSWFRFDSEGFNNSFDISSEEQIDILLMGSSHMEAVNVSSNANTGYLLNEYLPDMRTYNIGISGHDIYRCAGNLESAVDYYDPSGYVVIETDRVMLDQNMMTAVIDGTITPIPSHDKGMVYRVQKYIPCVLPLYRALDNWRNNEQSVETENEKIRDLNASDEQYKELLDRFIALISHSADGRKVIIVYHPETVLNDNGNMLCENDKYVRMFDDACGNNGVVFVDMYDDFNDIYESDHILAHGFSNTAIGTGHLNETGHELIAKRLAACIEELEHGIE